MREEKKAAPAAVAGPVAYRVLRKRHDGEWVTDGRAWCDGVPTQDLVDDIAQRSEGWRIEYAYAAPTTQAAPVAQGDAEQRQMDAKHAAIYRWMLSNIADAWNIIDNWRDDAEAGTYELHDALAARAQAKKGGAA